MNENNKYIALTFDDGPNCTTTNDVLDVLERYGITASFFLVGNNIDGQSAKTVKRAFDMGCEINSHSRTHSVMPELSDEEIVSEMEFTAERIKEITGEAPHFFRPPYIAADDRMYDIIDLPFICGKGAEDWEDHVSAEERTKRILSQAEDGLIILLHDMEGNFRTVEAIDSIIPALLEQGYIFTTVSGLFKAKNIKPKKGVLYSNVMLRDP